MIIIYYVVLNLVFFAIFFVLAFFLIAKPYEPKEDAKNFVYKDDKGIVRAKQMVKKIPGMKLNFKPRALRFTGSWRIHTKVDGKEIKLR